MRHDWWDWWSFIENKYFTCTDLTFEGADYRMSCFYNFRDRSNKSTRWLCFQKKASSFQIHKSIYMHSHACLQLGKGCKFAIWISHSTQHIWKVCAMHGALFAYHKRSQWIYRLVENIFELKHIMMGPLTQKIEKPKINKSWYILL